MFKRRPHSSILNVLMKYDTSKYEEVSKKDEFDKSDDIGKYFLYSYSNINVNASDYGIVSKDCYLLIIKNNRTINFHKINNKNNKENNKEKKEYKDRDREQTKEENNKNKETKREEYKKENEDTYMIDEDVEEVEFKNNELGLRKMYVVKVPKKRIQKVYLNYIMEVPVKGNNYSFNFCAFLEHGNKLSMFFYNPNEIEYVSDNETITLDSITIRDIFPGVKSMYHEDSVTGFSEVYELLLYFLKKNKSRLKGFDHFERLFESAINNYKRINSIEDHISYEGLCINKCYLDEKIFESFSSFSYLDDSVINFFNQFIYKYIMDNTQKGTWVVLSTYFISKIKQYKDPVEAFKNTWKWTKKFKRPLPLNDFIFIPVNISQVHWSLLIIANPCRAITNKNRDSERIKKASIIHLDSLGQHQLDDDVCSLLKNYLYQEFEHRCKSYRERGYRFQLGSEYWELVKPVRAIPKQNNGYDCGIFLIEYIIYLVLNPKTFSQLIPERNGEVFVDLTPKNEFGRSYKWFTQSQIQRRRLNMKQVLVFMRDNPRWSHDSSKVQYIVNKMTKQY